MARLTRDRQWGRPGPGTVIAMLALVLAMSGFAVAATNSGDGVIHGCVVKSGGEKGLLRVVNGAKCPRGQRALIFNQQGPAGPAGPVGARGASGEPGAPGVAATNPSLPPLEAVNFIGAPGEPAFENGAGNSGGGTKAGFYKDQSGIVHLQGEVNMGVGGNVIFFLPAGFRPVEQVCTSASAFNPSTVFVTDRVCASSSGSVDNAQGTGTQFISLNGLSFRAAAG